MIKPYRLFLFFALINCSLFGSSESNINSSLLTFPINPTLLPSCAKPTMELATDPPEIVSSIFKDESNFLNSSHVKDKKRFQSYINLTNDAPNDIQNDAPNDSNTNTNSESENK